MRKTQYEKAVDQFFKSMMIIAAATAVAMATVEIAYSAETELEVKCNAGDAEACKTDFRQHFLGNKDQITDTHTWWNGWAHQLESSLWKATQVFNGFVIFQHPAEKYGIAVSEKGLGEVHMGDSLKYSAQCIKYGGNADMVNNRGQKIVIRIYQRVACPAEAQ